MYGVCEESFKKSRGEPAQSTTNTPPTTTATTALKRPQTFSLDMASSASPSAAPVEDEDEDDDEAVLARDCVCEKPIGAVNVVTAVAALDADDNLSKREVQSRELL